LIGEKKGVVVCWSDIFGSETKEAAGDIAWVLPSCEHSLDSVAGGVGVAIAEAFVDCGNDIVMLFAVAVVVHGFPEGLLDDFGGDFAVFGHHHGGFEEVAGVAEVAVGEFGDGGINPLL